MFLNMFFPFREVFLPVVSYNLFPISNKNVNNSAVQTNFSLCDAVASAISRAKKEAAGGFPEVRGHLSPYAGLTPSSGNSGKITGRRSNSLVS